MAVLVALRGLASRPNDAAGAGAPTPRPLWLFALLAAITAASLAALPLASAVALPRVLWKTTASPALVAPRGETWRRLRGPTVQVQGGDGLPDLAVPVIDAADHWVLFGLLSGAPVQGLPPAPPGALGPRAPRICQTDRDVCRPWPAGWPDPLRPLQLGDSVWSKEISASPLAYDVESGLYLRQVNLPEDRIPAAHAAIAALPVPARAPDHPPLPMIEVVGRLSTSPPREGMTALFIVRSITGGQLRAMRVVSGPADIGRSAASVSPSSGNGQGSASAGPSSSNEDPDFASEGMHTFSLQRASVDLDAGRRVLSYFARPALWITAFALPAGLLASILAPLWFALRNRRGAGPESSGPASLIPSRRTAFTWISPAAASIATFAAGLATAAPAAVALASLWGSR